MCGRFVATSDPERLADVFSIDESKAEQLPPSWNVAPTHEVYAVVEHEERRLLVTFQWGLVPHWADDPGIGSRMINARAETVAEKPAYRDAFARRRCLLPADGFYEWRRNPDGSKTPFFVHRADGLPMAFAGLWSIWHADGRRASERLRTCAIVTTTATDALAAVHERMPVVLEPDAWPVWLDRGHPTPGALTDLLVASPAKLVAVPVGTAVGNVRNDHPGLVESVGEPLVSVGEG